MAHERRCSAHRALLLQRRPPVPDSRQELNWISKNLTEVLPAAVYVCNLEGVIVAFNRRATELWGRTPQLDDTDEKVCGSHRLFGSDGTYMPHPETPMEAVLRTGDSAQHAVSRKTSSAIARNCSGNDLHHQANYPS